MFGLRSKKPEVKVEDRVVEDVGQAAAELKRIAAIPFPVACVPQRLVESQKQRTYAEVAQSLGFMPAELVRAQLLEFFEAEGIKLYDYDQVSAWLTKKKADAGVEHWCWRPLREKDIVEGYQWGYDGATHKWIDGFYSSANKHWECRPYARLVPQHALEKTVKIEKKFGDQVKFFVSDYARPDVDPFIMVRPATCHDGNLEYNLVFDAWDEPGFGA